MLISPPFLPPHLDQDDDAYLQRAMRSPEHGNFPVSHKLSWHGGLHLEAPARTNGREPVRAIADGIVAYVRQPTARPATATEDEKHVLGYTGWTDDGCIIIRHDSTIGAQNDAETPVRFYSIYMHMQTIRGIKAGQTIYRKAELGSAGSFEGHANIIHFEIICDDDNLKRLLGRNMGDLNITTNGRTDAVFGEIYFRLPGDTRLYTQRPPLTEKSGSGETVLNESLFVGVRFRGGNAYVSTYRADGTRVGAALTENDAEYELYRQAGKVVQAYGAARASQVPSHSAVYELLRFGRILGPDRLTPGDVPHWRQISTANGQGWVNLNAPGVFKYSDADAPHWAGWQLLMDYDDQNSRCDIDVLRKMLDEDGDGITTRSEAENRLKNTEVQRAMRGMVCKFPTEWQRGGIAERWNWLTQEGPNMETSAAPSLNDSTYLPQADFPEFQRHVEALAFWEDASLGADIGSVHWHFHPVKFFQHFRKCGWLSSKELHQILSAAPKQGRARAEAIRIASNKVLRKYLIATSPLRCSHFLAQVGHETGWWQFRSESGLDRYFRTMYEVITPEEAATDFRKGKAQSLQLVRKGETEQEYAKRRPEAVLKKAEGLHNGAANAKVGGRAGDGVLFKGRGFLQITGRKNYTSYSIYRGQDFTTPPNPELVASDDYNACDVSGFYWSRENVNKEASSGSDRNHVTRVGGKINRGRADRVPLHDNERWEAFTSIWRKMNDTP
ncbi:hypothetical protein [Herbaspirillum sp.]|uniref:hypothetical protein n=1 Tax=Herbaspirillum sp. TaxID=1890675 RepID=UPI000C0B772D|nr:hypothetical protein [Herbaspirillum sp.]MAF03289.1 hypothetical protein [Herbaspirillum sp.]MBO16286.1 hypothetical protein [Herbaspirillum sp.]